MLDDGLISLRIESITDTDIVCTVENDGVIKTKKGVKRSRCAPVHAVYEPA